jgi:hypothetical protein
MGPSGQALGDLLAARRRRLFVGRSAELELVRSALDSLELPFSVLFVQGPGGIGKSSLLDVVAGLAKDAGAIVARVDGRTVSPTPPALLEVLGRSLVVPEGDGAITGHGDRVVLLIDTYERLAPLDEWVRTRLLPRLPASALTVIAGRSPPDPAWRADLGWGELLRVVSLRNLTPAESIEFLRRSGIDESALGEILRVAHGHPLGLALLADVASRSGEVAVDPMAPDVVAVLLRRFVDMVPSELHRRTLEVCALARATTEALLREALELDDAHDLFTWMRDLSFVAPGSDGLYPHELARDVLDADLRWRDLDDYKRVFHRVWAHVLRHLRSATGREQQQAIFDLKFVFRNLSGVLSPVDWESWGGFYPERASEVDREAIVEIVLAAEGRESASIAERWLVRQPEGFFVLRPHDGAIRGFLALLDLTRAASEDIAADPGARAAWDFANGRCPARPGETITQTRYVIDRESYQDPSPTLNATPILTWQRYLSTANLSWDFLTLAEPDRWNEYFAVADLPRAEGADFAVGGRTFGLFAHDFRRVPVDSWIERVAERALAREFTPMEETSAPLVLSQPEFEQAVRQGLHDLQRPDLLARNPLLQTRLLRDRVGKEEPGASALDALLRDAVGALGEHPRDDKLLRAVDGTFLRAARTQESAAAALGLPFSTYRRHLTQGVARIVTWLWDQEIYGAREQK